MEALDSLVTCSILRFDIDVPTLAVPAEIHPRSRLTVGTPRVANFTNLSQATIISQS